MSTDVVLFVELPSDTLQHLLSFLSPSALARVELCCAQLHVKLCTAATRSCDALWRAHCARRWREWNWEGDHAPTRDWRATFVRRIEIDRNVAGLLFGVAATVPAGPTIAVPAVCRQCYRTHEGSADFDAFSATAVAEAVNHVAHASIPQLDRPGEGRRYGAGAALLCADLSLVPRLAGADVLLPSNISMCGAVGGPGACVEHGHSQGDSHASDIPRNELFGIFGTTEAADCTPTVFETDTPQRRRARCRERAREYAHAAALCNKASGELSTGLGAQYHARRVRLSLAWLYAGRGLRATFSLLAPPSIEDAKVAAFVRRSTVSTHLVNRRVMLVGLISRTDLNGRHGVVLGCTDPPAQRYQVRIDNAQTILVKPSNITEAPVDNGVTIHEAQEQHQRSERSLTARAFRNAWHDAAIFTAAAGAHYQTSALRVAALLGGARALGKYLQPWEGAKMERDAEDMTMRRLRRAARRARRALGRALPSAVEPQDTSRNEQMDVTLTAAQRQALSTLRLQPPLSLSNESELLMAVQALMYQLFGGAASNTSNAEYQPPEVPQELRKGRRRGSPREPRTLDLRPETGNSYYSWRNSHIDEVIRRRRGIPITLAVATMVAAEMMGLQGRVRGIGAPRHYVLAAWLEPVNGLPEGHAQKPRTTPAFYIDAFAGGKILNLDELTTQLCHDGDNPQHIKNLLRDAVPCSTPALLTRMARNLRMLLMRQMHHTTVHQRTTMQQDALDDQGRVQQNVWGHDAGDPSGSDSESDFDCDTTLQSSDISQESKDPRSKVLGMLAPAVRARYDRGRDGLFEYDSQFVRWQLEGVIAFHLSVVAASRHGDIHRIEQLEVDELSTAKEESGLIHLMSQLQWHQARMEPCAFGQDPVLPNILQFIASLPARRTSHSKCTFHVECDSSLMWNMWLSPSAQHPESESRLDAWPALRKPHRLYSVPPFAQGSDVFPGTCSIPVQAMIVGLVQALTEFSAARGCGSDLLSAALRPSDVQTGSSAHDIWQAEEWDTVETWLTKSEQTKLHAFFAPCPESDTVAKASTLRVLPSGENVLVKDDDVHDAALTGRVAVFLGSDVEPRVYWWRMRQWNTGSETYEVAPDEIDQAHVEMQQSLLRLLWKCVVSDAQMPVAPPYLLVRKRRVSSRSTPLKLYRVTGGKAQCAEVAATKRSADGTDASASESSRSAQSSQRVRFFVGQQIRHKKYDYSGVIVGWDISCKMPRSWQAQMNVAALPGGKQQPFYNVLPDTRSRPDGTPTYVAQCNIAALEVVTGTNASRTSDVGVQHPDLGKYFIGRVRPHLSRVCREPQHKATSTHLQTVNHYFYVPNATLRLMYPDDFDVMEPFTTESEVLVRDLEGRHAVPQEQAPRLETLGEFLQQGGEKGHTHEHEHTQTKTKTQN